MGKFTRPYFSTLRDLHSLIKSENVIKIHVNTWLFGVEDFIKTKHEEICHKQIRYIIDIGPLENQTF